MLTADFLLNPGDRIIAVGRTGSGPKADVGRNLTPHKFHRQALISALPPALPELK